MVGRVLGTDGEERKGFSSAIHGRACLMYDELDVSLIEIALFP
jgi:hypothetical protein